MHQLHLPHSLTIWQAAISQHLIDDLDDIWNDIFEISQTERTQYMETRSPRKNSAAHKLNSMCNIFLTVDILIEKLFASKYLKFIMAFVSLQSMASGSYRAPASTRMWTMRRTSAPWTRPHPTSRPFIAALAPPMAATRLEDSPVWWGY